MHKTRRPIIAANWKANGSRQRIADLLFHIKMDVHDTHNIDIIIFPPTIFLEQTERLLTNTSIAWGAQNFYFESGGAFTGEIPISMLSEFHCRYVLVGHSERRILFKETLDEVELKYRAAIVGNIIPIICIGETQTERENHLTEQVLYAQLECVFSVLREKSAKRFVIAYEPIWAIGSGTAAQPEAVQIVHALIRKWVAEYDAPAAASLPILYGGSVQQNNVCALFKMPDIDGFLIGSASLHAMEFLKIIHLCNNSLQSYIS